MIKMPIQNFGCAFSILYTAPKSIFILLLQRSVASCPSLLIMFISFFNLLDVVGFSLIPSLPPYYRRLIHFGYLLIYTLLSYSFSLYEIFTLFHFNCCSKTQHSLGNHPKDAYITSGFPSSQSLLYSSLFFFLLIVFMFDIPPKS